MEWRPCQIDAGNAGSYVIGAASVGTTMDSMANQIATNALDYKSFDVSRPFKRFYRVSKYAKQKLVAWRSATDAITGVNGGFNFLPNCIT